MNTGLLESQVVSLLQGTSTITSVVPAGKIFDSFVPEERTPLPYILVQAESMTESVEVVWTKGFLEVFVFMNTNTVAPLNQLCDIIYQVLHRRTFLSGTNWASLQFVSSTLIVPTDARQGVKGRRLAFRSSEVYKE